MFCNWLWPNGFKGRVFWEHIEKGWILQKFVLDVLGFRAENTCAAMDWPTNVLIPPLISHQSTTELTLQRATKMLVKVEPCDSGGSFEAAIVPRIRQALQEPSRLQVVVSCIFNINYLEKRLFLKSFLSFIWVAFKAIAILYSSEQGLWATFVGTHLWHMIVFNDSISWDRYKHVSCLFPNVLHSWLNDCMYVWSCKSEGRTWKHCQQNC